MGLMLNEMLWLMDGRECCGMGALTMSNNKKVKSAVAGWRLLVGASRLSRTWRQPKL